MFERAERVLRAGYSVVLDAVFAKRETSAQAAEALALKVGVPFEGLWLDVPKEVAQARVAGRDADASDATAAVVERQFGYDLGRITWERRRLDFQQKVSNHSLHGNGTDRRPARRWSSSPCQAAPRAGTGPARRPAWAGCPAVACWRAWPTPSARWWLRRSASPLVGEIDAIARTLGRPGIWLLHGAYAFGCTALADESADGPVLRRTLDWPFPGLGRLVEVIRQRGAAGEFLSVTWPGFAGVLTAVAPGRFAASINQAPMRRRTSVGWLLWLDYVLNALAAFCHQRPSAARACASPGVRNVRDVR